MPDFVKENKFNVFHLTTTLNCGNMKNESFRKRFCDSVSLDYKKIVFADQVHGTDVRKVSSENSNTFIDKCDGIITDDKNICLCIFTADCMPVFIASKDGKVVAMVHAGWRGLAGGIIKNAVNMFKTDFGISAENLSAYIGPHIHKCCYEVGGDLKKVFSVSESENHLSLSSHAEKQLKSLNVSDIFISSHCTCHEKETFFSYRRNPSPERIMSLIRCR